MELHADELIRRTEEKGGYVILLTACPPEDDGFRGAYLYFSSPKEKISLMGELPCKLPEVIKDIIFCSQH